MGSLDKYYYYLIIIIIIIIIIKPDLLPDTLHEPAPHVMVLTPHTSVFTMLRQSGTEKVFVGLGPTKSK